MPNMTKHYEEMWLHARDLKRDNKLYSFELRQQGIYIKRYQSENRATPCYYISDIDNHVRKMELKFNKM